ncbi:MAG: hypothetical protein HC854_00415 [Flavobacterium sp.]|nr:hypothetical protein [Flavobacterium sp.]
MNLKILKDKSYHFYLVVSILFLILGFFMPFKQDNTLDINIHDTYYVIAYKHLYWIFSMVLCINWIVYNLIALFKVNINKIARNIQILMAIVSCIGIIFPYDFLQTKNEFPLFDDYFYTNRLLLFLQ